MLALDYINWHYTVAPARILGLLHNYLLGTWHRFLIGTHFKTLLSPWHRARSSDVGRVQNFGDRVINTIIDFYIRIIAAMIRLIIILVGLMAELILLVTFLILFIVWLLWPVIFIWFIGRGLNLIL